SCSRNLGFQLLGFPLSEILFQRSGSSFLARRSSSKAGSGFSENGELPIRRPFAAHTNPRATATVFSTLGDQISASDFSVPAPDSARARPWSAGSTHHATAQASAPKARRRPRLTNAALRELWLNSRHHWRRGGVLQRM